LESSIGQFLMVTTTSPVQNLIGMLRKPNVPVTIEQMNQMIASCGATSVTIKRLA